MKGKFIIKYKHLTFLCVILLVACSQQKNSDLTALIEEVGSKYAPDSRDEVYEVMAVETGGKSVFKGVTTVAVAKTELLQRATQKGIMFSDSIALLPELSLDGKIFGVVNVSVADARVASDYGAEMGTQYLLGSVADILQKRGNWLRVRGSDGYLAWMDESNLTVFNRQDFEQWNAASKVIFTDFFGFAYEKPDIHSLHVSDLVFGNIASLKELSGNFFKVAYPDGREAYIQRKQSQRYDEWLETTEQPLTGSAICATALQFIGIPYTWGGTSVKGMDCSGFVKTVCLMHGIVLRRDASQQAKTGRAVALTEDCKNLQAGDLLFFGKAAKDGKHEQVRHVAIYLGDKRFIHANGRIKINSLDPARSDYDAGNAAELLRATRIIGAIGTEGIRKIK